MVADKILSTADSPLSRFRKLSPTLNHAFADYPLFYEAVNKFLSVAIVHYFAAFFARVVLAFKTELLDHLTPFVYDYYVAADEWVLSHVVLKAEAYIPQLKTLHYADFKPAALKKTASNYIALAKSYAESSKENVTSYVKTTADPIVANTVSSVNPVLAPVNKTLETVLQTYLPADTTTAAVSDAVPTPSTDSNEVSKLISLTRDATGRTINVVHNTATKAIKIPSDLSGHFSTVYGNELKTHKSVPSALIHTSTELVSEVKTKVGLNKKVAEVADAVTTKVNGLAESAAEATVKASGAVRETVDSVDNQVSGQISVGA